MPSSALILTHVLWRGSTVNSCVHSSDVVKDYIQEAKAHMNQTCQDMEEGLSLTSHYVDVQLSHREIRSGKNTNKCLDKELVIMGDTDRQKSLLGKSQVRVSPLLDSSQINEKR